MKSNRVRALLVFVTGAMAFVMFAELFLISISPANIFLTASLFFFLMMIQMRFRTQLGDRDQDGGMAAWGLPVMFVLGAASCAGVFYFTYLWASGSLV